MTSVLRSIQTTRWRTGTDHTDFGSTSDRGLESRPRRHSPHLLADYIRPYLRMAGSRLLIEHGSQCLLRQSRKAPAICPEMASGSTQREHKFNPLLCLGQRDSQAALLR